MDHEWQHLYDAGTDALKEGNFKVAEQKLFGALASAEHFGDKDPRLANTLEKLVEATWYGGQFGQVEAHARRLLLLYQNTVGPDHFKTACISYRLANLYHYEQKLGLAEPLYKQVTTVMMKWLGSNHPELARIMDDYADLLHATHRTDQADYIKRCAESIKAGRWGQPGQSTAANSGPNSQAAPTVNKPGDLSNAQKTSISDGGPSPKLADGGALRLPPKPPHLTPQTLPPSVALSSQQKQPMLASHPGSVSASPRLADNSINAKSATGELTNPTTARSNTSQNDFPRLAASTAHSPNQASSSSGAGVPQAVVPVASPSSAPAPNPNPFSPTAKVPPPATQNNVNARISQTMKNLDEVWNKTRAEAEAQTNRGELDNAEKSWYGAVKVAEKVTGNAQRLAYSLDSLGEVLCRQEKYFMAEPHFKRSFKIKKEALGPDNPLVATAANTMAKLHYMQGHYREAEDFAEESAKIYERAHGKDHPDTATSLHNLATLYHIQCKYKEAENCYQRGLSARKKTLGDDHPDTVRIKKNYADLLTTTNRHDEAQRLNAKATGLITGNWTVIEIPPDEALN
ncbi:MAG: tetratricopeptide repeat protein [Leptolyngbya sp.]|nr:tetratricopeptide repeat protein [Candidatus Melainabacteria bacterium]